MRVALVIRDAAGHAVLALWGSEMLRRTNTPWLQMFSRCVALLQLSAGSRLMVV